LAVVVDKCLGVAENGFPVGRELNQLRVLRAFAAVSEMHSATGTLRGLVSLFAPVRTLVVDVQVARHTDLGFTLLEKLHGGAVAQPSGRTVHAPWAGIAGGFKFTAHRGILAESIGIFILYP
jgi:hypothetical protein